MKGLGVQQNHTEAVRLFRLAAAQGLAQAQGGLAVQYAVGQGVQKDIVKAYMWSDLTSRQGYGNASTVRDALAKELSAQQITEAQRLAKRCLESSYKDCD